MRRGQEVATLTGDEREMFRWVDPVLSESRVFYVKSEVIR